MDKKSVIYGVALSNGLSRDGLQRISGMPPATFTRRMADPDSLTLGEFRQIVKETGMKDETILMMVKEVHRRTK